MDGHVAGLVKQDLVVSLGSSLGVSEVLGQALPVGTDGADDSDLVLLAQLCDEVNVAISSVHGNVAAFHLIALGDVGIQAFAHSLGCAPDIVFGWLTHRFPSTHMDLICERHLRIVEGPVKDTELPGFSCFEKVTLP